MSAVEFWVSGRPAPQGSKRALGPGRMIEMSKYLKPWRMAVAVEGARHMGYHSLDLLDGPLRLVVTFHLTRPGKPKFEEPATPPDLSKLVRATEDALTGTVWVDDARVTSCTSKKRWAGADGPGAHIRIETTTEESA